GWSVSRQHREQQQRHDVGELDYRGDGGARRVLVGVADGVAGDGGLVGVRALLVGDAAAVGKTVLEALLGVVPGAAAGGHRDGDEQAGDDDAHQHGAERGKAFRLAGDPEDHHEDDDRRQHGQQRGDDHFLDRRLGQHVDRPAVIGLVGAGHDARLLLELPPDLDHHGLRRAADGRHGEAAEEEGQQAAEQQADDDIGVGQREVDRPHAVEERPLRRLVGEVGEVLGVGGEQHQGAEAGRADGVALGDRLGGVTHRVERVGVVAHFVGQARHFGDAAGIVGDRAEGIERHDHAGQRQHGGHGHGDAEQAGEDVGDDDAGNDHQRRQGGGFQRHGEALDDVGAVAGDRSFGDRVHRAPAGAGVVFGDNDDQAGDDQPGDAAPEQAPRREGLGGGAELDVEAAEHQVEHRQQRDQRQDAGGDDALVEGAHDVGARTEADEIGADDGGNDAGAADGERQHHAGELVGVGQDDRRQHHGGDDGHHIGFEQIGRHAGAVADIVADIVGDGRGVARVILGDAGFDLADHVAA